MNNEPLQSRHKAKRITIFNHKGGVGKTTLTIHIAAALAAFKKRVLLVDADPQCNLTSYFVDDLVLDKMLDESDGDMGSTLWSGVKPLVDTIGRIKNIKSIESGCTNVYYLPGDIRLSEFEDELRDAWIDCLKRKPRGFNNIAALSSIVNKEAEAIGADYIFYDSGPNIGPLNKVIVLDCDFFIIPMACDLFSLRALKTLGYTLDKWIKEWETIITLAPDGLYLMPGKPRFLGYIPQRFRVYRGHPSAAYKGILPKMGKNINNEIVVTLKRIDEKLADGSTKDFKIGEIQDFSSISNAAQKQGVPMWDVYPSEAKIGLKAKNDFKKIAESIINKTNQNENV